MNQHEPDTREADAVERQLRILKFSAQYCRDRNPRAAAFRPSQPPRRPTLLEMAGNPPTTRADEFEDDDNTELL
jgi:hypothetical protein